MGATRMNGPILDKCAKCGSIIESGGVYCIEGKRMFLFIRDKQPHYGTAQQRDSALEGFQGSTPGVPYNFGMDEMNPIQPYYFEVPEIKEFWDISIWKDVMQGIKWHLLSAFSQGAYCICDKCAETSGGKCPQCSTTLTSMK